MAGAPAVPSAEASLVPASLPPELPPPASVPPPPAPAPPVVDPAAAPVARPRVPDGAGPGSSDEEQAKRRPVPRMQRGRLRFIRRSVAELHRCFKRPLVWADLYFP